MQAVRQYRVYIGASHSQMVMNNMLRSDFKGIHLSRHLPSS